MRTASLSLTILAALALSACGGGSGGSGSGTSPVPGTGGAGGGSGGGGGGGGLAPNPGPQVALILSNGHSPGVPNYMGPTVGPQLSNAIANAGFTVQTFAFTDDLASWQSFVTRLQQIRDDWIDGVQDPTRVVIVGHSHGVVRSHAAVRSVADCPIHQLVDLDGSSVGWTLLTHGPDNAAMGGAPEGAYALGVQITCPTSAVGSAGGNHDLEDVVFPHVEFGYEVRSGDVLPNPANPLTTIEYDERWNARPDGSVTGLTCVFSGTPHAEVALAGGVTMAGVQTWILQQLGTP